MYNSILLRYGEIGLKSTRTRPIFEKHYLKAIEDAFKKNFVNVYEIKNLGGRFVIICDNALAVCEILQRVAGIQSLSPAVQIKFSSKKDVITSIKKIHSKTVKDKTFGVKVKRVGNHSFTSMGLAKEIGDALYPTSKGVNLTDPDIMIRVEIRDKEAYVFTESLEAIGGLPSGTSEKVLCLFSGGIDSPIAALQMIKRGAQPDFLFVNIMDEKLLNDVSRVYNYLIANYAFGYTPKFYVINAKEIIDKVKKQVPDSLRQIAYKIILYKIGEIIAQKYKYPCLVSGEALAQKSSQTLKSLLFIEKQVEIPMLRPLLTFDKIDIMAIARKLGTLSISEKIKEYCSLSEGAVTTSPRFSDIEKIPDFKDEIEKSVEGIIENKGLISITSAPKVELDKTIISVDMRSTVLQEKSSLKTDLKYNYAGVFEKLDSFQKNKSYLFICEFGVRSEDAAYTLRKKGIKAAGVSTEDFIKYFSKK